MARRIYDDFDRDLLRRVQKRTDYTAVDRAHYLNDAMQLIINEFPHPEFEGTADEVLLAGTNTLVPVTPGVWWVRLVRDAVANRIIDNSSMDQVEKSIRSSPGSPDRFYWWAGAIEFNRTPQADLLLKVFYKRQPAEWSSGSPLSNKAYDMLIPMRAASIALSSVGDQAAAILQDVEYNNMVARMRVPAYEDQKNDRRMGVRPRLR
jgi:hypothetical protein